MSKLIFRYGAMGSSKTANALMVRYNYVEKGKKVVLLKPRCENRDGAKVIKSRIGLVEPCEFAEDFLENYSGEHYDCIIVDEVQFLAPEIIDRLSDLVDTYGITVICYGLRADFSLKGFPGSTRLLELAHTIEEMKTICTCGRKAICNCRKVNGRFVFEGEQVAIDQQNDVQYVSMCPQCYFREKRAFYAAREARNG